ncbi:hypothetical protein CGLAMM_11410 [Acetobacteraceae bacterium EV16G]
MIATSPRKSVTRKTALAVRLVRCTLTTRYAPTARSTSDTVSPIARQARLAAPCGSLRLVTGSCACWEDALREPIRTNSASQSHNFPFCQTSRVRVVVGSSAFDISPITVPRAPSSAPGSGRGGRPCRPAQILSPCRAARRSPTYDAGGPKRHRGDPQWQPHRSPAPGRLSGEAGRTGRANLI